jgi:hypothetical protein
MKVVISNKDEWIEAHVINAEIGDMMTLKVKDEDGKDFSITGEVMEILSN